MVPLLFGKKKSTTEKFLKLKKIDHELKMFNVRGTREAIGCAALECLM